MDVKDIRRITATVEEVARVCDASRRVVLLNDSTLTIRPIDHEGKTLVFNRAAGVTVTLPPATGGGGRYRFFVKTTVTSNSAKIQVANASDVMAGMAIQSQDGGNTVQAWETASTTDTVTMDGSTKGGILGDLVELEDIAPNLWRVHAILAGTGTEATPFSAAVS